MTNFNELQEETREIITDLLNDGSDPDALYIIEHHIAHYDFDTLEKIAVDAFKAGYEVSEAEEFEDENGKVIFCFDIISEVELKPEIIDAQQKEILPLVEKYKGIYDGWGRILKIQMRKMMNTVMMANFLTMKMSKTTTNVYINNNKGRIKPPLIFILPK